MRIGVPLLVFPALALLAGCSNRDRANPLDPANPNTGGAPSGFVALAGDGRVDLHWNSVSASSGLLGFHLYRKTPIDADYRSIAVLPPSSTGYADLGALNGLDHRYRLYYVSDDGTDRQPGVEDVATPGRVRIWVVDGGRDALYRVTPDGRRIAATYTGFNAPSEVAVDSVSGAVWVSDSFGGRVVVLNPATNVRITIPGLVTPSGLAVDPLARVTWVCDEGGGRVYAFDPIGDPSGAALEPLDVPIAAAVDVFDRSVLVCERNANKLRRYASDHSLLATIAINRPSRVAVDSLTRRAWVTSFESGTLSSVLPSFTGLEHTISGLQGPIGVAVDARRGRIWVAESTIGRATAYDRSGNVLIRATSLPQVREVAIEPESGEVWAVLPNDGKLVRLTPAGTVRQWLTTFSQPLGVAIDPGR